MNFNEPKWVEVSTEGEFSGKKYFGRFCLKPYLTHGERADAVRLAEMYYRGIQQDSAQKMFLTSLAFLKFHVVETDAEWWKTQDGLSMVDESPVYKLLEELNKIQNVGKKKEEAPKNE
jgi:hypothetical protein